MELDPQTKHKILGLLVDIQKEVFDLPTNFVMDKVREIINLIDEQ